MLQFILLVVIFFKLQHFCILGGNLCVEPHAVESVTVRTSRAKLEDACEVFREFSQVLFFTVVICFNCSDVFGAIRILEGIQVRGGLAAH